MSVLLRKSQRFSYNSFKRQDRPRDPEPNQIKINKQKLPVGFFRERKNRSMMSDRYRSQEMNEYYEDSIWKYGLAINDRKRRKSEVKDLAENNENLLLDVLSSTRQTRKVLKQHNFQVQQAFADRTNWLPSVHKRYLSHLYA